MLALANFRRRAATIQFASIREICVKAPFDFPSFRAENF